MSQYLSPLRVEHIDPWSYWDNDSWHPNDGTSRWQLTEPFLYYSSELKRTVELPTGFRYDKASVPLAPIIYEMFGDRYTRPAAVHDYLCRMRRFPRARCDRVFLEAMRLDNALEIEAMEQAGIDTDEIVERKSFLESRAQTMYAAVALYSKSGLWKKPESDPSEPAPFVGSN